MRIKIEQTDEEAAVNLMPLIDMVFLLLIFFLVATTIAQEEREIAVQLPGTSTVEPLSATPKQLIINIRSDGTLRVAGQTYDAAELDALLGRIAGDQPQREVLIRADERSIHKYFAGVANLCRKVGIDEVKIGYIVDEPTSQNVR